MKIDINQKKITIGDKYNIFVDEQQAYTASAELFKLLSVVNLFDNESNRARMTIKKKWSWWGAKYDLVRYDNNVFEFKTMSVWKIHYTCQVENDLYEINGHRGRKHSVFKNGTQVAWWDKDAVSWFEGDNYAIIADDDADREMLIAFCLLLDNYASNDHNETVTIDFGNIGFGSKKFDANWRPSYK
ncbi:MAG TPA: hypothetical protein VK668_16095 [Mucilaginibacter sp.]|nr:hypothetical protein [Mucilaginibacter sp.]